MEAQRKLEKDNRNEEHKKLEANRRVFEMINNRVIIVKELNRDLKKVIPRTFIGKTIGANAKDWIVTMEKYLHV